MSFAADDLRYAQTVGVCVELVLLSGEKLLAGVHEVNEDGGFVSLYAPQTFQDSTTTRKIGLDLIASVVVTNIQYG